MKVSIFRRFKKNERGASLIEFALVLPILIALVLGILEFGWLFNGWITINGAAREGARIASAQRLFEGDEDYDGGQYIIDAVENHMVSLKDHFLPLDTDIDFYDNGKSGANKRIGVVVSVDGRMEPLIGVYVSGPQNLHGKATMRIE